jgi:hypothetical protein
MIRKNGQIWILLIFFLVMLSCTVVSTSSEDSANSIPPTYTPYPTHTPFETSFVVTSKPNPTNTPDGTASQVFKVEGETAKWKPLQTGIFIQSGDLVQISYISGEWWIGQDLNNSWQSQTPTDANGYTGRDADRVKSLLGIENPDRCRPLLSAPFGSLIGSIGENGALFLIGNNAEFTAQDSGILYLRINYLDHNRETNCPYGDGGEISVRVAITPP